MEAEHALLSSAATTLGDVADRIEGVAGALTDQQEESLAADLYEVERTIRIALRRLDAVLRRVS